MVSIGNYGSFKKKKQLSLQQFCATLTKQKNIKLSLCLEYELILVLNLQANCYNSNPQ